MVAISDTSSQNLLQPCKKKKKKKKQTKKKRLGHVFSFQKFLWNCCVQMVLQGLSVFYGPMNAIKERNLKLIRFEVQEK